MPTNISGYKAVFKHVNNEIRRKIAEAKEKYMTMSRNRTAQKDQGSNVNREDKYFSFS